MKPNFVSTAGGMAHQMVYGNSTSNNSTSTRWHGQGGYYNSSHREPPQRLLTTHRKSDAYRAGILQKRKNSLLDRFNNRLTRLTTPIPQRIRNINRIGNVLNKTSGMGRKALGNAFDFVAKRPKVLGSLLGVGGIGAIGFGISYGIAEMGRARNKAPVVHTGAIRNTGQTNQYFNLGQDPFAGVRFAARRR